MVVMPATAEEETHMNACKMLSEKLTSGQMQQNIVKMKGKTVLMNNPT